MNKRTETEPVELKRDEKLVLQLYRRYKNGNGKMNWKQAWQDNPDMKKRLRYSANDKVNQLAHDILAKLRQRGLLGQAEQPQKQEAPQPSPESVMDRLRAVQEYLTDMQVRQAHEALDYILKERALLQQQGVPARMEIRLVTPQNTMTHRT